MGANSNTRTNTPTQVPALPGIPAGASPELRKYLETLTQVVAIRLGRRGDPRDRAVTMRELIDSGLAKELATSPFDPNRSGNAGFVQPGASLVDLAVPPAPTGFTASGAYSQINLNWDYPAYSNHSHTEVHVHTSDVIGDATLLGIQTGRVFVDPVGSGQTRYYWVRHVNTEGLAGPFNSASGTVASTALDVVHLLTQLTNQITSSQLTVDLRSPIGNLPANTTSAIAAVQASVDAVSSGFEDWDSTKAYQVDDVVKVSTSSSKLYLCVSAVSANSGITLANTSYWKLYGDYDALKSSTDTSAAAITQINTISSSSNSAAAAAINSLNSEVFASDGSSLLASASAFSTLQAAVNHTDTGLAATAFVVNVLEGILLNNLGNPIVTASNLSTMSTSLLDTNGNARASAAQMDQLAATYTNPTTGAANSVSLQQALNVSASQVDGLRGQYTVKIDNNGNVAGFGLANTTTAAGSTSEFTVNADRFAIVSSTDTLKRVPFAVQTTSLTLADGTVIPAGVYIESAAIKDASITNAKIGTLGAEKITSGTIDADRIGANSIEASKLILDNSTITSQTINGVPTVIIKDLGVGTAQIKNLGVSTLKIQDQAVTFPNAITTSANLSVPSSSSNTTFATIQTLTGTYSGAPVLISGSFAVRSHDDQALMRFRLRRGSTVLFTSSSKAVRQSPDLFIIPFNFLDLNTSVGSRTYTLQAYVQDQYGNYSDRTISTLEVKK